MKNLSLPDASRICGDNASQPDINGLNCIAVRALVSLFDSERQLFARRVTLTKQGLRRDGVSRRRTIIALLGLRRLAHAGEKYPFDLVTMQEAVLSDVSWVKGIGDLGLLTWFAATSAPERLEALFEQFDFGTALKFYPDARQARTRGLAWFLAGLAHSKLARQPGLPDVTDIAVETYHRLENNQGEDGIFSHAGSPSSICEAFWTRCGMFSDQAYSIYALSRFAQAFEIEEPLGAAMDCVNSICALQGGKGQWWFLYDKRRPRVVNRYPVLSVHQDGIAPTALLALQEVVGHSFEKPISKGLCWITGANELGDDLRTLSGALIWDSISPSTRSTRYVEAALSFLGISRSTSEQNLRVCYEARPDHFGWLLYAFGKYGLTDGAVAAQAAKAH